MNRKKVAEETRLTEEEREFATQNHNLIYTIMRAYHFPIEEYYGAAAYGYIKSVMDYNRKPELRQYCFSTIARNKIRTYCSNEINSEKRHSGRAECSLNKIIDAEGNEYGDFQQDSSNPYRELEDREDMKRLLEKITPKLTCDQQKQLICLLEGYKPREIWGMKKTGGTKHTTETWRGSGELCFQ